MTIYPVRAFHDNYIWTIVENKKAFCIDPGDHEPLATFLITHQLQLTAILITHHHWDHVNGVAELQKQYPDVKVYGPQDERIPTVNHPLAIYQYLSILGCHFTVLPIPGHTSTHIAYFDADHHLLFCGDTLFSAGCGRVFDGTIEQLFDSLNILSNLPNHTQVYCGHEYTRHNLQFALSVEPENDMIKKHIYLLSQNPLSCSLPSTIGIEKQINPFFRLHSPSIRNYIEKRHFIDPTELEVFTKLREDKNYFKV